MFQEFQIKNIEDYITEDTRLVIDADGICYMPASIIDEMYIEVLHKSSSNVKEFKNITEFKGRTKAVSDDSWLGSLNVSRIAKGQQPFSLEDFEVTPKIREKMKIDIATNAIDNHISMICEKLKVPVERTILLLGGKENFRLDLPLPIQYKSDRNRDLTPTRLKQVRQYLIDNYNVEITEGIESDDKLEIYGFKGYLDYLKSGKFSYIVGSNDKDARATPSLLFDWSREDGEFKQEYPWLIPDSSKSVGAGEFNKGKGKYLGFINYCYQLLAGDTSDTYAPHKHLPRLPKEQQMGETKFFKLLMSCKDPKELLQCVVDTYVMWFPEGTQYVDWKGDEQNLNTLEWLELQWQCVYMKRTLKDTLTIKMLFDKFGVDYSKVLVKKEKQDE